ncbi:MAG: cytochrome c biogenesis protein CcsA [Campylobacterota bacterium]|nr:cytochrome c biogenesis protein CcsA [Campylobacterota bacterium]
MKKSLLSKTNKILFSYPTMLVLLILLGMGAAVATFIENDYGTSTARVVVYNHLWYEIVLGLTTINLIGVIVKLKMWRHSGKFIFHFSFVVMLIGAILTRYAGFEGIMHIREGKVEDRMVSLEPYLQITIEHQGQKYYQEYQFDLSALGNDFSYSIPFANKTLDVVYSDYKYAKKGNDEMGILKANVTLDGKTKLYKLVGKRGMNGYAQSENFGESKVHIVYGSKPMKLPFAIKLRDFQLDRYPGSKSPSSYASEVTLIDKANNKEFEYRIFMNHTLKYGNYQFFQSSYDQDEKGTVLSVNNDPGKWPTYLGYFLLTLGLLLNMFDKKSRFAKLIRYIKQFNSVAVAFVLLALLNAPLQANEAEYFKNYSKASFESSQKFGALITQSPMGRMKPLDSLNTEILSKLSRKSSFRGLSANQVILGMLTRPDIWQNVQMIKLKTPKLKKFLGIESTRKYIAFSELLSFQGYRLQGEVEKANQINPNKRGTYEKDLLKVDERLNIAYMVYYGKFFKIFPMMEDGHNHDRSKWFTPMEAMEHFHGQSQIEVSAMVQGLLSNVSKGNFEQANQAIDQIAQYQRKHGKEIIPSQSRIDNEILFNKLSIFPKLTLAYILIGLIIFIVSFITVFNKTWSSPKINLAFFWILALLFAAHTFGMGHRWYISGHAPWSDTYESLLYIAWSTMFAGLFFFRSSIMALSATVVMAGVFMFTAHLSGIDPQITNLVPVLKSYWLTIHVSIITGSYGFLAIGAMLGFMALLLFIFRGKGRSHIDETIREITAINEASLIIGLALLVVGNFLGGVWANESWGRYWGWDPKETWAWISIIVYIFVLHLRLIPKLNTPYIFSVVSTLAFASILMTYFGVNFYLSGMHSYATGDPVPVPTWVYVLTAMVFVVIILASRKRDIGRLKV